MPNFSPYADYGYLAVKAEAAAGTPLTPDTFIGFLSESVVPNFAISPVQVISGERERNIRSVPGKVEISGDVDFYVEPKTIGHFLRALFGAPTTQILTASVAFRHGFTVTDTPKTYTVDIAPADAPWVHRFYGTYINKLALGQADNIIKCTAGLAPTKAFISSRVTTAAASGTTLLVDQTAGLTADDTILVIDKDDGFTTIKELAITSVDSATQLTVATIDVQLDIDDIVVIKRQTPVYDQDLEFTWFGGMSLYTGDDVDNVTAEDVEDYSLEFMNETDPRWFGGIDESARYPGDILVKGYSAKGQISKFYDSESKLDKARKNEKIALRFLMKGDTAIEANVAVKASSTWGAAGFKVEAEAAGKAGNDINVTIVIAADDTLAVSKSGNNILISLANTTASKNTGTLIAAAIDALSGVAGTAVGAGTTQFTAAEANANLGFRGTGTDVVGRDASEMPYLEVDMSNARIDAYFPSASEDDILQEEMPFTVYMDTVGQQKKVWSTRVFLTNDVASY